MKIDVHTHILPPEIPKFKDKFGYGGFIQIEKTDDCCAKMLYDDGRFFREVHKNLWEPSARIDDCDESNIDVQVISTVPVMFNYQIPGKDGFEVARYLNDHVAATVAAHPKRFIGLGTLPLQDPELSVRELLRCKRDLGLAGVQIGSHVNEWNLDAPELFPVFKAAEQLGAAIFVHPWDMMGSDRMKKYWLPWLVGMPAEISLAICSLIFGGVLERLPNLRIAFAHGGGAFPATIGRIEHGFVARPDLCAVDNQVNPREYLGKFWVDGLVHDPMALLFIIDLLGADRVMMGSDYPFPLGEEHPGELIEGLAGLKPQIRQDLLANNALKWLGRKREEFA